MTGLRNVELAVLLLALGALVGCGDSAGSDDDGSGGVSGNSGTGGSSGSSGDGGGDGGSGNGGSSGTSGSGGSSGTSGSGGSSGSSGSGGSGGDGGPDGGPDGGDDLWGPVDGGAPLDVCDPGATYGDPLPPLAERTATLIQDGFKFLEGPVWHTQPGALYFSDMDMANQGASGVPSKIWKFTPPDTFTEFVASSGTNGIALSIAGTFLACVHDTQTLALFGVPTGTRFDLPLQYNSETFNSPNDLTERSDGHIYFTDPDWQLPPRTAQIGFTGVYHYKDPGPPTLVDDTLDKPNGIALSPDGTTLYVGSSDADVIKYDLDGNGLHSNRTVFASPGPSDGFAIDCAGNLYVTTGMKVVVYAPDATKLGEISVAEAPANAAFGGLDRKTLLITARTGLYRIKLNVPGYPY